MLQIIGNSAMFQPTQLPKTNLNLLQQLTKKAQKTGRNSQVQHITPSVSPLREASPQIVYQHHRQISGNVSMPKSCIVSTHGISQLQRSTDHHLSSSSPNFQPEHKRSTRNMTNEISVTISSIKQQMLQNCATKPKLKLLTKPSPSAYNIIPAQQQTRLKVKSVANFNNKAEPSLQSKLSGLAIHSKPKTHLKQPSSGSRQQSPVVNSVKKKENRQSNFQHSQSVISLAEHNFQTNPTKGFPHQKISAASSIAPTPQKAQGYKEIQKDSTPKHTPSRVLQSSRGAVTYTVTQHQVKQIPTLADSIDGDEDNFQPKHKQDLQQIKRFINMKKGQSPTPEDKQNVARDKEQVNRLLLDMLKKVETNKAKSRSKPDSNNGSQAGSRGGSKSHINQGLPLGPSVNMATFLPQQPQGSNKTPKQSAQIIQINNFIQNGNQQPDTKAFSNYQWVAVSGSQNKMGQRRASEKRTTKGKPLVVQKQKRAGSADMAVLRVFRASSAKRTASEIVGFKFPHFQDTVISEQLMIERGKLIKYNKMYFQQHKSMPQTNLEFYKFVQLIGKGAFGKVILAIHKMTGRKVAIKAIDKAYMQDSYARQKVMQEVYILKKIRHFNIIRLYELFESEKHFLMVMEYAAGGDLLQYVKQKKRLDEAEAKLIFRQVVHGIAHCHCRSVLHRDIKLDNVLIDNLGHIQICDFGVSRLISKDEVIQEQCGTPAYLAPEIIADKGYRGFSVDVWSLGVLLYTMLQGTVPFKGASLNDLHELILKGSFQYPHPVSEEARDLIEKMLVNEPTQRASIPSILKHLWLREEGSEESSQEEDDIVVQCSFNPLMAQDSARSTDTQEQSMNPMMQQGGNINQLNLENLFDTDSRKDTHKLSQSSYNAVVQDFGTVHIDEEALKLLEELGYPRQQVVRSLSLGELNHATTTYNLLVTS